MSVAGTYKVQVMTQKGIQEGRLVLQVEGEILKGMLEYSAGRSEITNGKVSGDSIAFYTKIKTPFGPMRAAVMGSVNGDVLLGIAKLPMGSAKISGVRVSE